jgi:hypothetical protein
VVYTEGFTDPELESRESSINTAMSKLRIALPAYYKEYGQDDRLEFSLPKHGYVIQIAEREPSKASGNSAHGAGGDAPIGMGAKLEDSAIGGFKVRPFDEFFGAGDSTPGHRGVIIVQADRIPDALEGLAPNLGELIEKQPTHRFFKARTWINRWDIDGASAIRDEFQRHGQTIPILTLGDATPQEHLSSASFEVAMGLGFTDRTTKALQSCSEWLRVKGWDDTGDAVSLHARLGDRKPDRFRITKGDVGFRRLLPSDWKANEYVTSWNEMRSKSNTKDVRDYAMILRHTYLKSEGKRKVVFALGGFTERGTAAAGRYLAANWRDLWTRYVDGNFDGPSLGDFFILIEGPSLPDSVGEWWSDVKGFAVTPLALHAKAIDCEWSRRLKKKASKRFGN